MRISCTEHGKGKYPSLNLAQLGQQGCVAGGSDMLIPRNFHDTFAIDIPTGNLCHGTFPLNVHLTFQSLQGYASFLKRDGNAHRRNYALS